jgi:hypothetical protein
MSMSQTPDAVERWGKRIALRLSLVFAERKYKPVQDKTQDNILYSANAVIENE